MKKVYKYIITYSLIVLVITIIKNFTKKKKYITSNNCSGDCCSCDKCNRKCASYNDCYFEDFDI